MDQRAGRAAPRVAIIGSGFSGVGLGIRLKQAGFREFTIFEKADRLGGTWRENTYPGAACDTPAFDYCFSFEQKTDWSEKWAPQEEILDYLEHCAAQYGLHPHIRFDTEIASARFDAEAGLWRLRAASGEIFEAEVLATGTGQLNRPYVPEIPGLDAFRGECFHSAHWKHDYAFEGKDVAVVGNAASAIQFIPQIAPKARSLYIFQRSANWMLPRNNRAYTEREKEIFSRFPALARLYRWWIWLLFELRWPVFRGHRWLARRVEQLAIRNMRAQISDPELQEALVPDYPVGGKRILVSDDYYPTLERENVHVVTAGIERVRPEGIETRDGRHLRADALILATGFESTRFLAPMHIEGPGGRSLDDVWKEGAEAYLGLTVPGFPNFFMMYGPNTNLGHNSIIFMLECQIGYILDALKKMTRRGLKWIDVRPEVATDYNDRVQRELRETVWAQTERSWYKTRTGRITNNWSGSTVRYWWRTRRADLADYRTAPREDAGAAGGGGERAA